MASDADDGGGSFWATFNGPEAGAADLSPLETLLLSPDCSVEALLDEEDVIQEFKSGNEKLLSRMRTRDACLTLVEFITLDPAENANHARCFRYPFVSVELMTCNSGFFEFFVDPANNDVFLDELWGFLEATSPEEMNPVLAGYFSRAVAALLTRHMPEVVDYLQRRGAESLLKSFLERMHSRSLAELFARLLCQDQSSQMIFPVEGLIMRLLSCLQDPLPVGDTQENIQLVVVELVSQHEQICFGDELHRQLTSPQAIRLLVDNVFSGKADNVSAAASILSSTVWNSCVMFKGPNPAPSPSTLSPMSPPLLTLGSCADDDLVNTGMDDDPLAESWLEPNEAAASRPSSSSSPPRSPAFMPSTPSGASPSTGLMHEVCLHFSRIRSLLDAVLARSPDVVALPGGDIPGVGGTTLEVLTLLTMLVRTGCDEIFDAMLKEQLLPRCLEIFFRHPWSSLLHSQVRGMLMEILHCTDGVRPTLVLRLLKDGGLVERVVNEYREEQKYSLGERKKHARVGYMGHLHALCTELSTFGSKVQECGAALESVEGWSDFVLPYIARIEKIHEEQLGGGIPDGTANLASANFTSRVDANSGNNNDDDFMLDDLGDLDEIPSPPKDSGFDPDQSSGDSPGAMDAGPSSPWAASFDAGFEAPQSFDADFSSAEAFETGFGQSPAFETNFSQPPAFGTDFSQAQTFAADFSQSPDKAFAADFSQSPGTAAPAAAEPEVASGSFWDTQAPQEAPQAVSSPAAGANAWDSAAASEKPLADKEHWAAFDSAFAPIPAATKAAAAESQSPDAIKPEDLLQVLGGSLNTAEKREDGSGMRKAQWPAAASAQKAPMGAVPSTCAPTSNLGSSSFGDSSWNAFGGGLPTLSAGTASYGAQWPAEPVMQPARAAPAAPFAGAVGTENLFALLGETAQAPMSSPVFPSQPAAMSPAPTATPWPAAEGWAADFSSTAAPATAGADGWASDPFGPITSATPAGAASPASSAAGSDRSWVADFDPLA